MAESPGAAGHAREAEIGGVGEHGGHQGSRVVRWCAGPQMHEAIGEARPAVDFRGKLGDSQTRQHSVEAAGDRVDRFVLRRANGTDRQAVFSERGLQQVASGVSASTSRNGEAQLVHVAPVLERVAREYWPQKAHRRPRRKFLRADRMKLAQPS
jgi:hypothetical protein